MLAVNDQNRNPIEGRIIQQEPEAYRGNVAGAQSDLYNTFNPNRFDKAMKCSMNWSQVII